MRALLFAVLLGACTPRAQPVTAEHPAHPDAEPGRLAGPPSALRPGVADLGDPAARNQPASAEPAVDHSQHTAPAPSPAPVDHSQHTAAPEAAPKKAPKTKPTKPTKRPVRKPVEKPAEKPAEKPQTPPAENPHQGHHGH